ncbi:unnamed protein product [Protopolystoma xenopodis]|uniref:Uncharacterized protein n=1 Tax=Protopolystoma xenopodis TaxID=117903 RepID=A0A448X9R1_9PLAT|nr:unnamed protein product [Protopolystoma xenopodis]
MGQAATVSLLRDKVIGSLVTLVVSRSLHVSDAQSSENKPSTSPGSIPPSSHDGNIGRRGGLYGAEGLGGGSGMKDHTGDPTSGTSGRSAKHASDGTRRRAGTITSFAFKNIANDDITDDFLRSPTDSSILFSHYSVRGVNDGDDKVPPGSSSPKCEKDLETYVKLQANFMLMVFPTHASPSFKNTAPIA